MRDLIKMDLFKLKKTRFFIAVMIVAFGVTFAAPLLVKGFIELLKNMLESPGSSDPYSAGELQMLSRDLSRPIGFSAILRSPLGGLQLVTIPVMIFIVSFLHRDLNQGYIKNLAGQVPSRGYLAVSKYIVICLAEAVLFILGIAGSTLGTLISRGISFDSDVGSGLLECLLKLLILWGLSAVLLLISTGLGKKSFAIVVSVIFATGALAIIYMPLSFALQQLFNTPDIHIEQYVPDQMFGMTNINVGAALAGSLILIIAGLYGTVTLMNKRDVK